MIAQERFQAISDLVAQRQKLTVGELQNELGVSAATLRRDLAELEALGKIVRVHGAVVHPGFFRGEPSFAQKRRSSVNIKRAMALAAAELVPARATVFVDAGTTCLEVGRVLLARHDITLLTHSLPLAALAYEGESAAKVICIGGEVRTISGATVGALALSWLQNLRADWCFVGASGLSPGSGASTTELGEAAMKQAMLGRAEHKVLVADAAKWNKPVTVDFATWNNFDFWVTGGEFAPDAAKTIKKIGPRVVHAART
ncbi:MAG TPA: DeoR/GlpR family DNA-binding transcription regulator [Abditibacteriaceae bacterium]|jgi:DeoR/GlpR family transcriptional regulator of sugar metabolism